MFFILFFSEYFNINMHGTEPSTFALLNGSINIYQYKYTFNMYNPYQNLCSFWMSWTILVLSEFSILVWKWCCFHFFSLWSCYGTLWMSGWFSSQLSWTRNVQTSMSRPQEMTSPRCSLKSRRLITLFQVKPPHYCWMPKLWWKRQRDMPMARMSCLW